MFVHQAKKVIANIKLAELTLAFTLFKDFYESELCFSASIKSVDIVILGEFARALSELQTGVEPMEFKHRDGKIFGGRENICEFLNSKECQTAFVSAINDLNESKSDSEVTYEDGARKKVTTTTAKALQYVLTLIYDKPPVVKEVMEMKLDDTVILYMGAKGELTIGF